jgi:acetyltransferase-like isoleucine patch superfamily enzyme
MPKDIEDLLFKVRRRENRFYSKVKDILVRLLCLNLPAPKFIFRPLYELLVFWRFSSHFLMEKLFYDPIFKARCECCGKGLSLPNGIPWIEGNLKIRVGHNVTIDDNVFVSGHVHETPVLSIGDGTYLGYKVAINVGKSITIGKNCMIAGGCFIADNDGHPKEPDLRRHRFAVDAREIKPVVIEDDVWVGTGAVILKGVSIGSGSIVAANSLVTRSVPPNSIVMGVPAQVVILSIDRMQNRDEPPAEKGKGKSMPEFSKLAE